MDLHSSLSGLCTVKMCTTSTHLLQKLIYVALLPVFEAQKVKAVPEVTGYLQSDVTLTCPFKGRKDINITQLQWDLLPPEGKKIVIAVSNSQYGVDVPESPLKERVEITEHSLIIKNVEMADAGSYTCRVHTFPYGSAEETTKLVVREQMQLSSGIVAAIVTAVVLLLMIVAGGLYIVFTRRCNSSGRHRVLIDTSGPGIDAFRPSVIVREEDVVYSDIKLNPSRSAAPSPKHKHRDAVNADDVMYSEVVISRRLPNETMFAYCRTADEVPSYTC
ncbi:poliovirus receptor-related protein 2-like isoform X2 [Stegastes partitus]|uniref:Poliovirus receptor-related protein 2-like isoform X2 n=1 Tax=Stegastes partitus TaxID=144197 RepID=A0A9Y4N878_9TELE|nr:PREDICTED: poliovirus receptor-related protein 2-like isoform X2 [Stegastes partitus]